MLFSQILATAFVTITGIVASPLNQLAPRQALTTSSTGESNGFYYSFWTDGEATVTYENGDAGSYTVNWSGNKGNWVGGKGWETGSAR